MTDAQLCWCVTATCTAGQVWDLADPSAPTCKNCTVGYYQPVAVPNVTDTCVMCNAGSTTANEGSTKESDCACELAWGCNKWDDTDQDNRWPSHENFSPKDQWYLLSLKHYSEIQECNIFIKLCTSHTSHLWNYAHGLFICDVLCIVCNPFWEILYFQIMRICCPLHLNSNAMFWSGYRDLFAHWNVHLCYNGNYAI